MPSEAPPDRWHSLLVRLLLIAKPQMVRQALLASGVVGTVLVLLNQGDVLLSGHVTERVLVKSLLTPIIPFCVTMLGAFLNSRPAVQAEELRPGWPKPNTLVIGGNKGQRMTNERVIGLSLAHFKSPEAVYEALKCVQCPKSEREVPLIFHRNGLSRAYCPW